MLVLRSSSLSPFGRKVKITASLLGLMDRIEIVATDTTSPDDAIRTINPLGKIPALELEDGEVLFDSRVIVEYLDWLGGGGIIPVEPKARFQALRSQALADGIMDAAILQVYEARMREEPMRSERWLDHQAGKVARGLAAFELDPPAAGPRIGAIALACALGYLDIRFAGEWRRSHASLAEWLETFRAEVPAFDATAPH